MIIRGIGAMDRLDSGGVIYVSDGWDIGACHIELVNAK